MEKLLSSITKVTTHQPSPQAKRQKPYKKKSGVYGFIRYADDFLVTAKTQEDIIAIVPTLKEWLGQRGLELNEEKTKATNLRRDKSNEKDENESQVLVRGNVPRTKTPFGCFNSVETRLVQYLFR